MRFTSLADALQPGQRAWVSGMCAECTLLREQLAAQPERAAGVTFSGVQFPGIDTIDWLALHPDARQSAFFMTPALRRGLQQGRAELLALDYLGILRHLREGDPFDVAVAHLSAPDAGGWCSPGVAADFMPLVWPRARRKIAHLNPSMPRTRGSFRVHVSELDARVEADRPLTTVAEAAPGAVEARIAAHVAQLVRDGDTLQFGIGSVPMALGSALAQHRGLRIHGGMVSGSLRTLWDAGALDRDARITTGLVIGDEALMRFVQELPQLWMTDARTTHDPAVTGAIPRFVAINGAVEVDLFGQVNSERAGGAIQAGAGGLPAFAQGAWRSDGGRLVICLPSTARKGSVSRIVPALDAAALCTLPRGWADVVVTEHGAAQVRGLSVDARAQALIAIADPAHRDALADAWERIRAGL